MSDTPIDTNVVVRYLTESPGDPDPQFEGVFNFFEKLEVARLEVFLPELVLFHAYFVQLGLKKAFLGR